MGGIDRSRFKSRTGYQKERVILIILTMFITLISIPIPKVSAETIGVTSNITYSSSIAIDNNNGDVLLGENIHVRLPMASTTKIMTALLAVESGKLSDIVTIPKRAVGVEGSSIYLKVGEKYRLIDLVYGLMLRSGNDAATAIAIYLGGSVDGFVAKMNEKVAELGLKDTHFCNPHGLHDDNHYTSAYDLAMITRVALANKDFKQIVSSKSYRFKDNDGITKVFVNKNKLLRMYEGCIGVKTGFTKKAGRCLVSAMERNGLSITSVVLNHGNMWQDSMDNFNRCITMCRKIKFIDKNTVIESKRLDGKVFNAICKEEVNLYLRDDVIYDLWYKIEYDKNAVKNSQKGENIGKIYIFDGKRLLFEKNIYNMIV